MENETINYREFVSVQIGRTSHDKSKAEDAEA